VTTATVVVCVYTEKRWDDIVAAVESVASQDVPPVETLVVVDHNPALLDRAQAELTDVKVLANAHVQGLSGARNTAIAEAKGDVVVFLDDDARARPGWLAALLDPYEDATVQAVGGVAHPRWPTWPNGGRRPHLLPGAVPEDGDATGELDWIVGCTYTGQPTERAEVRNLMGCNMSFRREVFERIGGFDARYAPAYYEDTDLCFEARRLGYRVVYQPRARIVHLEGGTAGTDVASGFKRFQEINRAKFADKHAAALATQHPPDPARVFRARDRRPGLRICLVDHMVPLYDRDSGSVRMLEMLRLPGQ